MAKLRENWLYHSILDNKNAHKHHWEEMETQLVDKKAKQNPEDLGQLQDSNWHFLLPFHQ